jgi:cell division protein FtsB
MKKKKKLLKKVKYLIILLGLIVISGETIYSIVKNEYLLYKLKKEKKKLLEENAKLSEMIEYSNTKEFIEYNARIKLGLKKENEIEYRFEPPK